MKINLTYLFFAGLLGSVASAQAQVSEFSVCSRTSNSGSHQKHVGMTASENALVKITSTGGLIYNGFTPIVGDYLYTVPANTGATVYSTANEVATTVIKNEISPPLGYNTPNLIWNLSGRFYLEAPPSYYYDPPCQSGGTSPAKIRFMVGSGSNFSMDIWGRNYLAQFGLNGASDPVVDGPNGPYPGEGTFSLGYLSPGWYTLTVKLEPNSDDGEVVVSINAQ